MGGFQAASLQLQGQMQTITQLDDTDRRIKHYKVEIIMMMINNNDNKHAYADQIE
jgi:hypothetical protein